MKRKVKVWGGIGEKLSNNGTQWYLQNRIFDSDGLCPALTVMKSDFWVKMTDKDLIVDKIKFPVFKRKYPVDIVKLQDLLKKHKKATGLTNKDIATRLDVPLTNVAHWFRTDTYFSIPTREIWFDLKKVLNITDDSFDECLTVFEVVDGVYDMNNRVYDSNGIAPTLKCQNGGELIKERDLHCINPWKHQAQKVYLTDGCATTLSANGGGQGGKTGLYLVDNMDKKVIDENFTEVEDGKFITTERERESCYAVTTRPRSMPLHKKIDNYVLEDNKMLKLRESTKKGYKEAKVGDGVELSRSHCSIRRGVSHSDSTGALNCQEGSWGTVEKDYRIRKLTPTECERLQGFPDLWTKYGKDGEEISDTQRYKCCGNAVTTTVITHLINEMFKEVFDGDK